MTVITRISPSGYIRLQEVFWQTKNSGYSDDLASRCAQTAVGLEPAARELVVDYTLVGRVYPFMEKDSEDL